MRLYGAAFEAAIGQAGGINSGGCGTWQRGKFHVTDAVLWPQARRSVPSCEQPHMTKLEWTRLGMIGKWGQYVAHCGDGGHCKSSSDGDASSDPVWDVAGGNGPSWLTVDVPTEMQGPYTIVRFIGAQRGQATELEFYEATPVVGVAVDFSKNEAGAPKRSARRLQTCGGNGTPRHATQSVVIPHRTARAAAAAPPADAPLLFPCR